MKSTTTLFAIVLALLLVVSTAPAANRTASVTGNWGSTATWGGQSVPLAGDNATINAGVNVTVDVNAACTNLIINQNAAGDASLEFNNGVTLTVSGTLTWGQAAGRTGSVDMTYGGTFVLNGVVNATVGEYTLTPGSGTIIFSRTGAQTIPTATYNNLSLGGNNTKTAGGSLTVNGAFSIAAGPTFTAGALVHNFKGDFTNNGTFTQGTSTASFSGSSTQTISGSSAVTFNNLTVDNSAGIALGRNVSVAATLTLTSGNVTTSANALTLGTGTGALGTLSRTSGTIIGNFTRWFTNATVNNVLFPIGTASNYRPANISFTVRPNPGGTVTAFFTPSDPGGAGFPLNDGGVSIVNRGMDGYWTLTSGNGLTGGTYSLDLTADGFGGVSVVATLHLIKRPTGGGNWTVQGTHVAGTGTIATPVIHRTTMSGFSEFGVGGAADNTLPIQLASFTAVASGQHQVTLNWSTASETNNYGFEVQKSMKKTEEYQTVANSFVAGHGTTLKPVQYSYVDETAEPGVWYYRLKQIDLDGTEHYFEGVQVSVVLGVEETAPIVFALKQNYPNPFNPETQIKFSVEKSGVATLRVFNVLGQEVATLFNDVAEAGQYYTVKLNGLNLSSGIYFYRLESGAKSDLKRMLLLK